MTCSIRSISTCQHGPARIGGLQVLLASPSPNLYANEVVNSWDNLCDKRSSRPAGRAASGVRFAYRTFFWRTRSEKALQRMFAIQANASSHAGTVQSSRQNRDCKRKDRPDQPLEVTEAYGLERVGRYTFDHATDKWERTGKARAENIHAGAKFGHWTGGPRWHIQRQMCVNVLPGNTVGGTVTRSHPNY